MSVKYCFQVCIDQDGGWHAEAQGAPMNVNFPPGATHYLNDIYSLVFYKHDSEYDSWHVYVPGQDEPWKAISNPPYNEELANALPLIDPLIFSQGDSVDSIGEMLADAIATHEKTCVVRNHEGKAIGGIDWAKEGSDESVVIKVNGDHIEGFVDVLNDRSPLPNTWNSGKDPYVTTADAKTVTCPQCGKTSGDDWSQCPVNGCPMGGPQYNPDAAAHHADEEKR